MDNLYLTIIAFLKTVIIPSVVLLIATLMVADFIADSKLRRKNL